MISKDHKHQQQDTFQLHHNEIGVWGIGCTSLKQMFEHLKVSNPTTKIGYYDIKHEVESDVIDVSLCCKNIELHLNQNLTEPQIKLFFNDADLLIINGNHHSASKMMLILDGKKEFKPNEIYLEKTVAIFYNAQTKAHAADLKIKGKNIELIEGTTLNTIDNYLKKLIAKQKASINGLILTGGESSRMKQNKSLLVYHQQAQWLHLYDLLEGVCEKSFVSCTEKNAELFNQKPIIIDSLIGYGPLSGIISALLQLKNQALLVLACDLPLINAETINQLIEARDPSKMATTFLNPESKFLEPLITIYEPKALAIMLTMLSQGYSCPRKMLMQNDIKIIEPKNPMTLKNINFPEEREIVMEMIKKL